MTLTEMLSRVRSTAQDSGGTYITDAEITDYINDAYVDLVARLKLLQAETTSTIGSAGTSVTDGTIDLPADFMSVLSLRFGTDDAEQVDDETFWTYSDDGASPETSLFRIFNDKLEVYPKPASGQSFRLRYVKRPAELTGGAEPTLPQELHVKLVRYAQAMALLKDDQPAKADRYRADYETDLPPPNYKEKLQAGPYSIGVTLGPFDSIRLGRN